MERRGDVEKRFVEVVKIKRVKCRPQMKLGQRHSERRKKVIDYGGPFLHIIKHVFRKSYSILVSKY
jgi:hypothetical protein